MNKRILLATGLTVLGLAACGPPQVGQPIPPKPPCAEEVTRIYETNPIPCIPTPPQRLDVVPAMANQFDPIEQQAATNRCNSWGGIIIVQAINGVNVYVCRTVDLNLYGVWS